MVGETLGEVVGKSFPEESNVGFHDAGLGDVVVFVRRAVGVALALLFWAVFGSLSLHACSGLVCADFLKAFFAFGDATTLDVGEDGFAGDLCFALDA